MNKKETIKELTMMLMYLTRFTEHDKMFNTDFNYAWRGYDFDILNKLDEEDYIRQGKRPSRTKSVFISEQGIDYARELLKKYNIEE